MYVGHVGSGLGILWPRTDCLRWKAMAGFALLVILLMWHFQEKSGVIVTPKHFAWLLSGVFGLGRWWGSSLLQCGWLRIWQCSICHSFSQIWRLSISSCMVRASSWFLIFSSSRQSSANMLGLHPRWQVICEGQKEWGDKDDALGESKDDRVCAWVGAFQTTRCVLQERNPWTLTATTTLEVSKYVVVIKVGHNVTNNDVFKAFAGDWC